MYVYKRHEPYTKVYKIRTTLESMTYNCRDVLQS